jgi:hypothetical protein
VRRPLTGFSSIAAGDCSERIDRAAGRRRDSCIDIGGDSGELEALYL